tara:strand:- start:957 stop:1133 length:177 start_codon:yes stop_codon:yes gene_type:complete
VKLKSFRAVIDEPYKLRLLNRESFDSFLEQFEEGVILEIIVKEIESRTQLQNSSTGDK